MYCQSCGRENSKEACIHQASFNQFEQIFIFSLVITLPAIFFGTFFLILKDFELINYFQVGSFAIGTILLILLISYYAFDKLYIALFFGCHQKVSRSIKLFNKPFVLCARCTGLMVGMFLTVFISYIDFNYAWLLLGIIPLIVDGLIQAKTKYNSNNVKRFITGLLGGPTFVVVFGFGHFIFSRFIIETTLNIIN